MSESVIVCVWDRQEEIKLEPESKWHKPIHLLYVPGKHPEHDDTPAQSINKGFKLDFGVLWQTELAKATFKSRCTGSKIPIMIH